MSDIPTSSIISDICKESRASDYQNLTIPTFTLQDLEYLSSLNQTEFIEFRTKLINQLGSNASECIEELQDSNYMRMYETLGQEGIDNLKEFGTLYLETNGGWTTFNSLIPNKLSSKEIEIYLGMAVYIDKVARPLYLHITNGPMASRSNLACDAEAAMRLSIAGIDLGVDAFVDLMTGGTGLALTPLEGIAMGADLTSIWLDYEICNGRWH